MKILLRILRYGGWGWIPVGLIIVFIALLFVGILLEPLPVSTSDPTSRTIKEMRYGVEIRKLAEESESSNVESTAVHKLAGDPRLAETLKEYREHGGLPLGPWHIIIARQQGANIYFNKLAGNLNSPTSDAGEALARLHLALADPIIYGRIPKITMFANIETTSAHYSTREPGIVRSREAIGEIVTVSLKRGTEIIVTHQWSTAFNETMFAFGDVIFIGAHVEISVMLQKLLSLPEFTRGDFVKLSHSEIPEIRIVASERLKELDVN